MAKILAEVVTGPDGMFKAVFTYDGSVIGEFPVASGAEGEARIVEELRELAQSWLPKPRTAIPRGAKIYFLRAFGLAIGEASSLAGNRRAL